MWIEKSVGPVGRLTGGEDTVMNIQHNAQPEAWTPEGHSVRLNMGRPPAPLILRSGTPKISSLKRVLTMLELVIEDGGTSSVAALARKAGIPVATAHRQVATLVEEDYLVASPGRGHVAGKRLLSLVSGLDEKQVLVSFAAPVLSDLARKLRCVAQLGTLENNMVTYRVKRGSFATGCYTQVGTQLEAYCTGIGKALLAHLPQQDREEYLAAGPFVRLTDTTIVEPEDLSREFEATRSRGYAIDNAEMFSGLFCVAAPLIKPDGTVIAAISVSQSMDAKKTVELERVLEHLLPAAREIERIAFS